MESAAFARGVCPLRQHAKKRSYSQKLKKNHFFRAFSRFIKTYPLVTALGTVGESFSQKKLAGSADKGESGACGGWGVLLSCEVSVHCANTPKNALIHKN
jgi:hypothetical protein